MSETIGLSFFLEDRAGMAFKDAKMTPESFFRKGLEEPVVDEMNTPRLALSVC